MNSEHVTVSVILIHAHLTSQVRKDFCHDFIRQFKSFGYDVILTTHAPVDRDTQDLADYVIYDKDNLLLKNPEYKKYIDQLLSLAMVRKLSDSEEIDVDTESYEEIRSIAMDGEEFLIDPEA